MESEVPEISQSIAAEKVDLYAKFPLQKFESQKGRIAFREMVPEKLREGGEVPLVTMVGWAMNQDVVQNTNEGLVEAGQTVIPLDIVGGGKLKDFSLSPSGEIDRQARILRDWINGRSEKKINFMGQSMSAITLLHLIENHPEISDRIGAMLLVSPMGVGGKDSLIKGLMARKGVEDERNNAREKTPEDHQIEPIVEKSWKSHRNRHPLRAIKEIWAMAHADEYKVLEVLRAKGIKVGIIQGFDDKLADKDRLFAKIGEGYEATVKPVDPIKAKDKQVYQYTPSDQPPPPIDSLRQTMGGHEIMGPRKFAGTILRTIDRLNHPLTAEDVIAFNKKMRGENTPQSK